MAPAILDRFPRARLAHLPTPLEELPNLTARLGGPRILIKRDDATGLAMGGNKTRKLELLLGDALERGADTLVTEGGLQSNHCRQTAAAAARCGLDCELVLSRPDRGPVVTGNRLLDEILGARVRVVGSGDERPAEVERAVAQLEAEGRRPYVIPTGGSNGLGGAGYAAAMLEIVEQAEELGVALDVLVTASGSGGTQGGLEAGRRLANSDIRIVGMSDGEPAGVLAADVVRVARETAALLDLPASIGPGDVTIRDEYYGAGYGEPTDAMVAAVRLLARTEGVLLDPVYSGKAMAGLLDMVRRGELGPDQTVVFLHTGGTPALFAYAEAFEPVEASASPAGRPGG